MKLRYRVLQTGKKLILILFKSSRIIQFLELLILGSETRSYRFKAGFCIHYISDPVEQNGLRQLAEVQEDTSSTSDGELVSGVCDWTAHIVA